jgi:murein DD-endopeptidase MepM/ murein hydrolase activator NlpD
MRTSPVPGFPVSTPWGRRGRHWSCNRDSNGNGIHTGADIAAPNGTPIVAPLAGVVRHTAQGGAFGPHQFFIIPDADTRAAIFFGHTLDRPANGSRVTQGQRIARVGALGNATGPHLHFEWWPQHARGWGCGNNADPVPILTRLQGPAPPPPSNPPAKGWQIEGIIPMSATSIVYFTVNDGSGRICEARLLEGTWSHVPNPTVLTERRQSLDTSGIRWRDAGQTATARWGREVPWS